MRIVVLGYIVRGPLGGASWHFLQYIIGFMQLGNDVLFLEDSDNYPSCYNPDTFQTTIDASYGLIFIDKVFRKNNLQDRWAYYDEHTNNWFGRSRKEVHEFCESADLVVSIANINPVREWWVKIPKRILLDTDPAFTQLRHLEDERYRKAALEHTHFFTFGENFGKAECKIPNDGFDWKPTRQPVVLELWKVSKPTPSAKWTTVMLWDGNKVYHYNGLSFGMKSASFDDYFNFPEMVTDSLELAIGSSTAPRDLLSQAKWHISDSSTIARTPESFQKFILESKGEWSIAKQGYVSSKGGWFSERSTGYLASGKPVIVQNTGFSQVIETGRGVFGFNSPLEAVEAIDEINSNYAKQCVYAREIAEGYFDSKKVLRKLLNDAVS